jgi:molybdate transport system permease protein
MGEGRSQTNREAQTDASKILPTPVLWFSRSQLIFGVPSWNSSPRCIPRPGSEKIVGQMFTAEEWEAIELSLWVATWAVVASLPLAIPLGYFLARWKRPSKWLIETAVNLPLVLPPVVTGYILLVLFGSQGALGGPLEHWFGIHIAFSWIGAALAAGVVSFPLMVRTIRIAFSGVDERLEGVARTLGSGPLDTFLSVSLPLAFRGVLAGSMLAFARSLGEFGATIMLAGNIPARTQTIPTAVFSLVQTPGGVSRSGRLVLVSVLLACLTLAVSEILERRRQRRESA